MGYFQDKKSAAPGFLVMILIITAGFAIIFMVIPLIVKESDFVAADSICKASVALRAKTYTDISPGFGPVDVDIAKFGTPLLCKTSNLKLPQNKGADREEVKKQFAELMVSCWNRYGEGIIEDVFKEGGVGQKCQVCYIADLRKYKPGTVITADEFLDYLFETPYKVSSSDDRCKVDGGFCIGATSDCTSKIDAGHYLFQDSASSVCQKKGLTSCCYTEFECWNRGGICATQNPNTGDDWAGQYKVYEEWECPPDPPDMTCFVKNKDHYSYGEYIQRFGGDGVAMVMANLHPGETYAVSFGSPHEGCGWCKYLTVGLMVGGAVAGIALAIPTGGTSLILYGAYAAAAGAATGAALGLAAGAVTQEAIVMMTNIFKDRTDNTVYLTTLNLISEGDLCQIIGSI